MMIMESKKDKIINQEENLAICPETHHHYNTNSFPRICHTCEKVYMDRGDFLNETELLIHGKYSKGTRGKVFEYRNCECGSTLVCVVESKRDTSPEGLAKRQEFERKLIFLVNNGIERSRAREIVLAQLKREETLLQQHEDDDPSESAS